LKVVKNISTILITDIVGYSKLSGDNQEVALELLKEHDKILFNSIKNHNGTVLKNRGDGVIAQFNSPNDSVSMAVYVQRQFQKRNTLNVQSRNLNVRIGIHYGEYLQEGDEIHGDCINIASKLEPEAPSGGVIISKDLCTQIIDNSNIYIREFKQIVLTDKNEMTYEVYLDLIDWYKNKKNKYSVISNKSDLLDKAHSFYSKGDYSTALKFSVLASEKNSDINLPEVHSFIINHLVALGEFKIAENLLNNINVDEVINDDLKAQILKLHGHLLFNREKWSLAKTKYQESYQLFEKSKSKYCNEILFYLAAIDVINENKSSEIINIEIKNISDDYSELVLLASEYLKNKNEYKEIDYYIDKTENFKRNDLKSYAFWLINKLFFILKDLDQAFIYETKAQENLKTSSLDISDIYMRENFLNKIILNKIITSEATIQVDDLFDFEENEDEYFEIDIENNTIFFNYCIDCGKENIKNNQQCYYCDAFLFKSYYDKK